MASPHISFDSIPSSIRKPGKYFEFNTKLAVRTLPGNLQKVLMLGQKLVAGTQAAMAPVDVFSDEQAAQLFGRGSQLHLMVRAAIKANPYLQLTTVAIADPAGNAATGTTTLAGTATGSGVLTLWVGANRVDIAVNSGDTAAIVAAALAAPSPPSRTSRSPAPPQRAWLRIPATTRARSATISSWWPAAPRRA